MRSFGSALFDLWGKYMDIYRITFIGHRYIEENYDLEDKIYKIVKEKLANEEYVELYVGHSGEFDTLAASAVKRAQKSLEISNSSLILTLPYIMKDIELYERFYDDVIIPIPKTHPKSAITKRNCWMVDNCDLLIAYVLPERRGGALTALKYAKKKGIKIINLSLSNGRDRSA